MKWMQWIASWFGKTTKSQGSLGIGLRAALSGTAPGGWASDHREETAHNTGFNYIAIHAIAAQVAGATVTAFADGDLQYERRSHRKRLASRFGSFARWKSIYGADDRETDPLLPTHALIRLLRRPNPYESGANFRYRQAQQIRLTGTCLIWNVPSVSGRTCERYVIPTSMASPVPPSVEMPRGGWQISPVASRYTPIVDDGYVDCPSWYRILGQIIDARQVQVIRLPHAWYLDDGQSPLSAGAKWVDASEAVDDARFHQLKNGVDPSVVWNLPPDVSPDQDEIDRVQAKISAKYGGPENVGRVMVAQSGTSITPLSATPKDMCYSEGFQDFKSAVLALHQTPPVAVGLQEPGAYAAYNASMKAWRHAAIQPLCDMLAESDTETLAPQFGIGITIEIESDTVDDTDLIEQQLQNDLAAKARTRNEWRAVRGLKPLPGPQGDELVGTESSPAPSSQPADISNQTKPPQDDESDFRAEPDLTRTQAGFAKSQRLSEAIETTNTNTEIAPQTHVDRTLDDCGTIRNENCDRASDSNGFEVVDDTAQRVKLISEILFGLFGESVLPFHGDSDTSEEKSFDPSKHPRDRIGEFAPTRNQARVQEAKRVISSLLSGNGNAATPKTVSRHLAVLHTSELVDLHKPHGLNVPNPIRSHLEAHVRAHLEEFAGPNSRLIPKKERSNAVHVYIQHPDKVHQRVPRRTGNRDTPLTHEEWGQLVGAQPGSTVHVLPTGINRVKVVVDHPDYRALRKFDDTDEIQHVLMKVSRKKQGQGIAARALSKQVEAAAKLGYSRLSLFAAGAGRKVDSHHELTPFKEPPSSGFYAWPRLGFDGDIETLMKERATSGDKKLRAIAADFRRRFPGTSKVSQLMATKEGRDWWRDYGGDFTGEFDLSDESPHRRVLSEYLAEKETRKKKSLVAVPANNWLGADGTSHEFDDVHHAHFDSADHWPEETGTEWDQPDHENHDGFTDDDEEILDRIWDRMGRELNSDSM